MLRLHLLLVLSLAMTARLPAQEAPTKKAPENQDDRGILDDAYDFDQPPVLPDVKAASESEIRGAIYKGVQFLIEDQNKNGSWGSPTKTKGLNIYAPVPGAHHAFRAATTSLCISALIEVASDDADAIKALDRSEAWLSLMHI